MVKKILKYIAIVLGLLLVLDVALVLLWGHVSSHPKHADAIIVLGAAINSRVAQNRALEGLSLYEQGKAPILVLSGGKIAETDISEAEYMNKVVQAHATTHVPVILEKTSDNTYQNIYNSKALLPQAKSVIVVSDRFHIARGVLLALRAGFWPVSWASPEAPPFSGTKLAWYYVREMVAMISYIPKFMFN